MPRLDPDAALALRREEREHVETQEAERMRVALVQAEQERAWRAKPLTNAAKKLFIEGLAAGIPITKIAEALEYPRMMFYRHRDADPKFAEEWDKAIEVRTEPIVDRLTLIAQYGATDNMATVQAAKILLQGGIPRFRDKPPATTASAKLTKHADGSSSFETKLGPGSFSD